MTAGLIDIDYWVLAPVLVLVIDALAPRARGLHLPIGLTTLGAGLGALPYSVASATPTRTLCTPGPEGRCFYETGPTGLTLQLIALVASLLVLLMLGPGTRHLDRMQRGGPAVTVALVLAATAGAAMVVAARDLPTWLVAIELATLPAVALVALSRGRGAEGGALSLLMVSLTSFALLAVGIGLWVLATGDATFSTDTLRVAFDYPERHRVLLLAILSARWPRLQAIRGAVPHLDAAGLRGGGRADRRLPRDGVQGRCRRCGDRRGRPAGLGDRHGQR